MAKINNHEEIQLFLAKWKKEFREVLRKVILLELGYKEINGSFKRVPRAMQKLKKQKKKLINLSKSVVVLSKRSGVYLPQGTRKEFLIPISSGELIREFVSNLNLEISNLNDEIQKLKKDSVKRKRINTEIAFELTRALHFCGGSKFGITSFNDLQKNFLSVIVKTKVIPIKMEICRWLEKQKEANVKLLRMSKNTTMAAELKSNIADIEKEIWQIRKQSVFFSWSKQRTTQNLRWSTHLKEHLIRSILSKDLDRIAKSLNTTKILKEKEKLILDMEKRNANTLRTVA